MKIKKINGFFTLTMLFLALCVLVLPTQAHELTVHPNNLNALGNPDYGLTWSQYRTSPLQELLNFDSIVNLDVTYPYSKNLVKVGTIRALQVGDGECATFVKAVSKHDLTTDKWTRGRRVKGNENNIPAGTIIASFGSYTNYAKIPLKLKHVAVFGNPTSVSVNVWDQNYIAYPNYHVVGRHSLSYSGTQPNNLNYYYVVNVPD